jgi:hypothetical protein
LGCDDGGGDPQSNEPPPEPKGYIAEGGDSQLVLDGEQWYEVHVFKTAGGPYSLTFTANPASENIVADVLVVAGGGGAGGAPAGDKAGGGGAGGLWYETGKVLTLSDGSVGVTVGAGGPGGNNTTGTNGGDSSIGDITVPGGGGGGKAYATNQATPVVEDAKGRDGGSGGGGGALNTNNPYSGTPGKALNKANASHSYGKWGYDGGTAGPGSGGGGGGAAGPGGNVGSNDVAGTGGPGWVPTANAAAWITEVAGGITEFSRGGRGGSVKSGADEGQPGANYGDGGSGRNGSGATAGAGTDGHSGIVIVRFPAKQPPDSE